MWLSTNPSGIMNTASFAGPRLLKKTVRSLTTIYWSRHMLQKIAFGAQSVLKTSVRCSNGRSLHEMASEPSACTGLRGPSSLHSGRHWRGASDAGTLGLAMKRLSLMEISALLLGLCFILAGIVFLVRPASVIWGHPTTNPASRMPETNLEVVNENGCRIYGGLGVLVGAQGCN